MNLLRGRVAVAALTAIAASSLPLHAAQEQSPEELAERAAEHWAFQPLADQAAIAPEAIDRLVAARREAAGIVANDRADRRTLARRIYFQLTGLPPTREEIEDFLADNSPDAWSRLVDELLSRREFGERWGRHWLDVARYADSNGCSIEANNTYDNAWRYRDYVIAALNEDKPFDRFVVEQVAGDLLPATTDYQRSEHLIATGFLLLGPKAFGTGDIEQLRLDTVDDQIDTVGKAFLGLSLGCARCHDHKLEPVPTADYYSLAGIFGSTQSIIRQAGWRSSKTWNRVPLPVLDDAAAAVLRQAYEEKKKAAESGELTKRAQQELTDAQAALAELKKQSKQAAEELAKAKQRVADARFELDNAKRMAKVLPVVSPVPAAMAVEELEKPRDEAIRYGGDPHVKGDLAARAVLPLLGADHRERYAVPDHASGRLQLARWLVDVEHGAGRLAARVIVNRVWRHLIGQGVVPTVDNFGLTGEPPSHRELLDQLSAGFVADGWSIKRLIRRIVLSETYQLSGAAAADSLAADPGNRLLWRHTPRRLEVEALRDALLAVSGQLDRTPGGKTLQQLGLVTIRSDMIDLKTPSPYRRRTVYLPIVRDAIGLSGEMDAARVMLTAFDAAPPNLVCGARSSSTVPSQALFLLNSEFLAAQSRHTAERLLADQAMKTNHERIDALFIAAFARPATAQEVQEASRLLDSLTELDANSTGGGRAAWAGLCQAVFASNEFLFLR